MWALRGRVSVRGSLGKAARVYFTVEEDPRDGADKHVVARMWLKRDARSSQRKALVPSAAADVVTFRRVARASGRMSGSATASWQSGLSAFCFDQCCKNIKDTPS